MSGYVKERLPNLLSALLSIALGLFALYESRIYEVGELRDMGPGYFPLICAVALIGLGVLLFIVALRAPPSQFADERPTLLSLLLIGASLLSFALLIEDYGLFPAIAVAVFISTFASENRNILRSLLLALLTAAGCVVIFVYVLALPIKVFAL